MGHSATFQPKYSLRSTATIRPFWLKCHQKHLILERAANRRNKKFKQVHTQFTNNQNILRQMKQLVLR
jgi:hypothetical protein